MNVRKSKRLKLLALSASIALSISQADAAPLSFTQFNNIALTCGAVVAPTTLAAISKAESHWHNYALHNNNTGESLIPDDEEEALAVATQWLNSGNSIDVGIMQINSENFNKYGLTLRKALNPCSSIATAANILLDNFQVFSKKNNPQEALLEAISMYNTGNRKRGFENGYVRKVIAAAEQIVPAIQIPSIPLMPNLARREAKAPNLDTVDRTPEDWDVWKSYDKEKDDNGNSKNIIN